MEMRVVKMETIQRVPKDTGSQSDLVIFPLLSIPSSGMFSYGIAYGIGLSGSDMYAFVAVVSGAISLLSLMVCIALYLEVKKLSVATKTVTEHREPMPEPEPETFTVNHKGKSHEVTKERAGIELPNNFPVSGPQLDAMQKLVFSPSGEIANLSFSRSRLKSDGESIFTSEAFTELRKGLLIGGYIQEVGKGAKWTQKGIDLLWGQPYQPPHPAQEEVQD